MIAVIFELTPARPARYFDLAAELKPELERIPGFISVERFESLATPGKYLSLSFWRDEAAVQAWRNTAEHRAAQTEARAGVLADYRLRVAGVIRDYGMAPRNEAPPDSRSRHG
ncbi:antibiotic biosynthesis monooxygenase family protein [Paracoccus xiamenensis]|uniref:antibiotic biosynthesis monooxygenase family protein n=1 Tax=Paracoccus xiamenensis TaxID=2714901 RepID=UPI0014083601|nr:antibiotic biosynthesis monooxygenase [Paracoccus xiamenensis]NHF72118.1 antibiotic biosynthesis monooxygenase [Paracoccus xiamenensis]